MGIKLKVGDRVKHTEYGTLGSVIDFQPDGSVYIFWDNGTSGYYGYFHLPVDLICKA